MRRGRWKWRFSGAGETSGASSVDGSVYNVTTTLSGAGYENHDIVRLECPRLEARSPYLARVDEAIVYGKPNGWGFDELSSIGKRN
jgi:hypothetical protein